jgi:hypothetical protein
LAKFFRQLKTLSPPGAELELVQRDIDRLGEKLDGLDEKMDTVLREIKSLKAAKF